MIVRRDSLGSSSVDAQLTRPPPRCTLRNGHGASSKLTTVMHFCGSSSAHTAGPTDGVRRAIGRPSAAVEHGASSVHWREPRANLLLPFCETKIKANDRGRARWDNS
jgi:hypothetical protein